MSEEHVAALIRAHVLRYAAIDLMDVYKLLHQATFGPGQVIKNHKAAREWLERESETLVALPPEPLVESVHPDTEIVRLHLRPYLIAQGDLKKLLDAYIQSSRSVEGDPQVMAARWAIFQQMTQNGSQFGTRFDTRTVSLIGRTRASEQWPASHHSPPFDRTYKPVYRVLTRPLAESLLQGQNIPFTIV